MSTISLSLDKIYYLAKKTLLFNGCDEENASILSDTIMRAEKDGSLSHGLFRSQLISAATLFFCGIILNIAFCI